VLFNNQEALLFWNSSLSEYEVHSSEGSHSRFAPVGDLQCKLLKYVEDEVGVRHLFQFKFS